MKEIYFTTRVATDISFCNRENETRCLLRNIEKNQHTVVVSPRRYGKTSLVCHTLLNGSNLIFARVDLFCSVYEGDICQKIEKGISKIVREIATFSEKSIRLMEQCFKTAYIGFQSGKFEIKAELRKPLSDPVSQIEDLLEGLEKLASKCKKPVVFFFDEFQDVLKIDETHKIQAAIRAVAQHSRYVTYIFSGSSRLMLNEIFDDKNQPLYMLCDKILLERIHPDDFKKHIQRAAQKRWKNKLPEGLIEKIILNTQSHPYYVNVLCDKLWELEEVPNIEEIEKYWHKTLSENKGKIIADLEPLTTNRLKVITMIALLEPVNEPNSKLFLDQVKLPLASTQNAVKYLLDHDYIYEANDGLKCVDPLLREFIVNRYRE